MALALEAEVGILTFAGRTVMPEAKKFDPRVHTVQDLKNQPVEVVKTELPALAKALGVETSELFRSLAGYHPGAMADGDCRCCGNDSW